VPFVVFRAAACMPMCCAIVFVRCLSVCHTDGIHLITYLLFRPITQSRWLCKSRFSCIIYRW